MHLNPNFGKSGLHINKVQLTNKRFFLLLDDYQLKYSEVDNHYKYLKINGKMNEHTLCPKMHLREGGEVDFKLGFQGQFILEGNR